MVLSRVVVAVSIVIALHDGAESRGAWQSILVYNDGELKQKTAQNCVWNKDTDFPDEPPMIFDAYLNLLRPVMNDMTREVRVPSGTTLTIACPGRRNTISVLGQASVQATCVGGVMVDINQTERSLSTLGCAKKVRSSIRKKLGSCGAGDLGQLSIIGFRIGELFYEQIFVCFDYNAQTTLYTRHVIHGASISAKDTDDSRPSFKSSRGYFSVSMNTVYTQASQLKLLIDLLGNENLANSLFDTYKHYFARGHLAPDADFVTEAEQDATYYYINAAPQWQAFNNGNWKQLEYAIRELAEQRLRDLRVYTGGWDVLELNDINNNPVEVFLGLAKGQNVVPAPAITWKVIHDEFTNCAVAVVGVNNPHLTSPPTTLCQDLCASISWIDFDTTDLTQGYTYCCSVASLHSAVPHVPNLGNVSLLTGGSDC